MPIEKPMKISIRSQSQMDSLKRKATTKRSLMPTVNATRSRRRKAIQRPRSKRSGSPMQTLTRSVILTLIRTRLETSTQKSTLTVKSMRSCSLMGSARQIHLLKVTENQKHSRLAMCWQTETPKVNDWPTPKRLPLGSLTLMVKGMPIQSRSEIGTH
jgi:hypothetical protein